MVKKKTKKNVRTKKSKTTKKVKTTKKSKGKYSKQTKPIIWDVLSEQVKNLESGLQQAIKQIDVKTSEFLDRVEFESRVGELQSRILESIPKMEAELKSLETKISRAIQKPELESKLTEMENKITSITTEIEALKGKIKDIENPKDDSL
jgi:small-conductance mechanosensitive channel